MLPKKYRVPVDLFPKGARVFASSNLFSIKKAKNNLPYSRVGVIISKSSAKNATLRNKTKRTVFGAAGAIGVKKILPGNDYLVIIKPSAKIAHADQPSLKEELINIFAGAAKQK